MSEAVFTKDEVLTTVCGVLSDFLTDDMVVFLKHKIESALDIRNAMKDQELVDEYD